MAAETEHGTSAGYQRHRRDNDPPCGECKKAYADYMAGWRRRTRSPGETQAKGRRRATWRAIARLIDTHSEEYERLLAEEIAANTPP